MNREMSRFARLNGCTDAEYCRYAAVTYGVMHNGRMHDRPVIYLRNMKTGTMFETDYAEYLLSRNPYDTKKLGLSMEWFEIAAGFLTWLFADRKQHEFRVENNDIEHVKPEMIDAFADFYEAQVQPGCGSRCREVITAVLRLFLIGECDFRERYMPFERMRYMTSGQMKEAVPEFAFALRSRDDAACSPEDSLLPRRLPEGMAD